MLSRNIRCFKPTMDCRSKQIWYPIHEVLYISKPIVAAVNRILIERNRTKDLETQLTSLALKQKISAEEIEILKSHQVQQHDLQLKLRTSEKTRLELLSSLCESEATIKKLKIESMILQEEQQNTIDRERQLIQDNDKMWSVRLKSLQENFEKEKQALSMKNEKEQQLNSEKEKLRELMHRSISDSHRSASDLENAALPAKAPPRQNFQSIAAPQKQGEYQATKKPRTTTPNTSRKMPTNSLQIAAVNSVKNHILNHSNDEDLHDFIAESTISTTEESLSWNQVTLVLSDIKRLTFLVSFKRSVRVWIFLHLLSTDCGSSKQSQHNSEHQSNYVGKMPIKNPGRLLSKHSVEHFVLITVHLEFWKVSFPFWLIYIQISLYDHLYHEPPTFENVLHVFRPKFCWIVRKFWMNLHPTQSINQFFHSVENVSGFRWIARYFHENTCQSTSACKHFRNSWCGCKSKVVAAYPNGSLFAFDSWYKICKITLFRMNSTSATESLFQMHFHATRCSFYWFFIHSDMHVTIFASFFKSLSFHL